MIADPKPSDCAGSVLYTECTIIIRDANTPYISVDVIEVQGGVPRILLQQVMLLASSVPYFRRELGKVCSESPVGLVD